MRHVRAALALFLMVACVVLAAPGIGLHESTDVRLLRPQYGPVAGVVAALNRVRVPLARALWPLERPLRTGQDWHLYRDGPSRVHRLEVHVDGALRFRTNDVDDPVLAPILRDRRMRPVVETTARTAQSANWRGLARVVVDRVRSQDPEVQRVELVATTARWPGRRVREHHRIVAEAPTFDPRLVVPTPATGKP